jgi:hypothetical protein
MKLQKYPSVDFSEIISKMNGGKGLKIDLSQKDLLKEAFSTAARTGIFP